MVANPSSKYTVEDLKVLQGILDKVLLEHPENEVIRKVSAALTVIMHKGAVDAAKKHICVDDCANYTGAGYNALLFDAPLSDLPNMKIHAGYLGKAIVDWRLRINK